jgi:hypothetical protein
MIEFLCPNEHKIRCPDDKAGLPAKCPRCGVTFRIPDLEELSLSVSATSDGEEEVVDSPADSTAPPPPGHSSDLSGHPPGPVEAPDEERQIEFLCPNGHHLHGPASLQGRAGECPECRSRFHIPVVDEPELAPEPLAEPELADETETPPEAEIRSDSGLLNAPAAAGALAGRYGSSTTVHPLAALFVELWAARDAGSRVEIHLESGSVLTPDGYVRSHSMQDYAVLVTKDPDGRSTATIVPWKSISRIILRALEEVPGEVVR